VTSSTTRLSSVEATEINSAPTGRILIYDRLEFVAIHLWEVVIANVLLEFRIGPGVGQSGGIILWTETYSRNVEIA
jgi:hypothetical protein